MLSFNMTDKTLIRGKSFIKLKKTIKTILLNIKHDVFSQKHSICFSHI